MLNCTPHMYIQDWIQSEDMMSHCGHVVNILKSSSIHSKPVKWIVQLNEWPQQIRQAMFDKKNAFVALRSGDV